MSNLQNQFAKFHRNIKMESSELREKRDIIFKKIKKSLSENKHPIPEILNQGSYIYGVGIKPINEQDCDIDIGLVFNIKSKDYNPKDIRKWVYEAIKNHTSDVQDKGPCIRVNYKQENYHVDLVCYAKYKNNDINECFQLAHKNGSWILSDPKKIKSHIEQAREKFKNTNDSSDSDQLHRVVRYLKRWVDKLYPTDSSNKPIGLATLLYYIQQLDCSFFDDVQALLKVVGDAAKTQGRISVYKPDTQGDVFIKISEKGMEALKEKFKSLEKDLLKAINSDNLKTACEIMRGQFGEDFPLEDDNKIKNVLSAAVGSYKNPIQSYGIT